jgi:tRNA U54 and U55 pseudouridine synthase Pus10
MYADSVEEIIAGPLLEKTGGDGVAFHASDAKDVDARMLGN